MSSFSGLNLQIIPSSSVLPICKERFTYLEESCYMKKTNTYTYNRAE